ncbi:hypothetical protein GCK32_003935, partial [Trichostrongylus colubriformis]
TDEAKKTAASAGGYIQDKFAQGQDKAGELKHEADKGVSSAFDSAKSQVSSFASDAKLETKKVSDRYVPELSHGSNARSLKERWLAGDATAETAHGVAEKLKHDAHYAAESGHAKLQSAEDSAAKALEHAKQKVGELSNVASQKASELSAHAREEMKAAERSAKESASSGTHKAHEFGNPAEVSPSTIAEAKSALTDACDAIQERATAIVEEVRRVTESPPQSPDKVPGVIASVIYNK